MQIEPEPIIIISIVFNQSIHLNIFTQHTDTVTYITVQHFDAKLKTYHQHHQYSDCSFQRRSTSWQGLGALRDFDNRNAWNLPTSCGIRSSKGLRWDRHDSEEAGRTHSIA
jgi:hypothetical protein